MRSLETFLPWVGALLAVAVVYAPVLASLAQDWIRDPNYSHGILIPLVSLFLLRSRRRELAALHAAPSNLGLLGVVLALCLLILGTAAEEVFTQRISFVALVGAIVLFLGGRRLFARVAFPVSFLVFAIPLPYVLYYSLTGSMQHFAARGAVRGLQAIGVPAMIQGNIIHLPETSLEVADACSGIRSLYAFLALGALLARSMPIPTWGRIAVFLVTIPLSVVANSLRVWSTGLGAYLVGPSVTSGTVHELFGLIVFATALGVFLLVRKVAHGLWSSAP